MSFVNIISAIGNNNSVYPLLVRDCGIENPVKIGLTYKQNLKESEKIAKEAFRERTIDEYVCSGIWLGCIPVTENVCDYGIRKMGYDPNVDMALFKENNKQGLKTNIQKFKNLAPAETKGLQKVLSNKKTYEKLMAVKFVLSTAIPVFLMGYCLPKSNFALTRSLRNKEKLAEEKKENKNKETNSKNISFKGSFVTNLANMSTVNKMAITDGGLTVGRVSTGRNKNEKLELGFKMLGMMFLNFVAPAWIAKFFDNASNKLFDTNVNLDPKILNNKNFIEAIKNNTFKLPKNNNIIEFLDERPNEKFSELVGEFLNIKRLKNGARDPRKFVDEKKVADFKLELENFINQAKKSSNIENFAKKALRVKSFNILSNIIISSCLLAIGLPKLTFYLRKLITGSELEPGLVVDKAC